MKNPNPEIIGSSTEHVNRAEIEMVINRNSQKFKENWSTKSFVWRIAEKSKGRYYWFTSCRHCHFKKMVITIGTGVVKAYDPGTIVQIYFVSEWQASPLLVLNTFMWLTITLILGTSVLFLELLIFLQIYKSCFYNYTLLHIKQRLYLEATEIELDFCFEFFAF